MKKITKTLLAGLTIKSKDIKPLRNILRFIIINKKEEKKRFLNVEILLKFVQIVRRKIASFN